MQDYLVAEPGRFSVSLPGYDVHTAKLDQLAFDARFGSMRETERGVLYGLHGGRAVGMSGPFIAYDPQWATVFFSRPYSQPPTIAFAVENARTGSAEYNACGFMSFGWPQPILNSCRYVWAVVAVDSVTFWSGLRSDLFNPDPLGTGYVQYQFFDDTNYYPLANIRWIALA